MLFNVNIMIQWILMPTLNAANTFFFLFFFKKI